MGEIGRPEGLSRLARKELNVFWESNPTNIKSPVFWGNIHTTLTFNKNFMPVITHIHDAVARFSAPLGEKVYTDLHS